MVKEATCAETSEITPCFARRFKRYLVRTKYVRSKYQVGSNHSDFVLCVQSTCEASTASTANPFYFVRQEVSTTYEIIDTGSAPSCPFLHGTCLLRIEEFQNEEFQNEESKIERMKIEKMKVDRPKFFQSSFFRIED
jgi:hypothetical protein